MHCQDALVYRARPSAFTFAGGSINTTVGTVHLRSDVLMRTIPTLAAGLQGTLAKSHPGGRWFESGAWLRPAGGGAVVGTTDAVVLVENE